MQFASCQWNPYAKMFIQKMYPSKIIDDSKMPLLIGLINEDVLRVQDPDFHYPCQVVAGTNYGVLRDKEISEAISEFQRAVHEDTTREDV